MTVGDNSAWVLRRYTFKMYPNSAQAVVLEHQLRLHCDLYNALLQQRIEAWSRQGKSLTYYDQCKELTALRADDPEYRALSSASMAATAQRLDRAFQAFFRRAKSGAGAASGFPRFQSWRRYPGFGFKKHRSGWEWRPSEGWRNGKLRTQGVPGWVRVRGKLPVPAEEIRCCEVLWREGTWWLSLVVRQPVRLKARHGKARIELDLIDDFAGVEISADGPRRAGPEVGSESAEGRISPVGARAYPVPGAEPPGTGGESGASMRTISSSMGAEPPGTGDESGERHRICVGSGLPETGGESGISVERMLHSPGAEPFEQQRIADLQRAMARCRRWSGNYRRLVRRKARIEARIARRRREALHRWSTGIVRRSDDVTMVGPADLKSTTASGRGSVRRWGAAVKIKAVLNRHILDFAPGEARAQLEYKLAEAGGAFAYVEKEAHGTAVGAALVETRRAVRRARRTIRKERDLS